MPMPLLRSRSHQPWPNYLRPKTVITTASDAVSELRKLAAGARLNEKSARNGIRHYKPNPERAEQHRITAEALEFAIDHLTSVCIIKNGADHGNAS